MPKGLSSVQRTLRYLEQQGYITGIVERYNRYAGKHGIRQDLFGVFDLISIMPIGICGVQVCGQDFKAHNEKILDSEIALEWLRAGGQIQLIGWRKIKATLVNGKKGKAMRWSPRIKTFKIEDFE